MARLVLVAAFFACALVAQPPAPGTGAIRGVVLNSQTNAPVRRATIVLTAPQIRLVADSDGEGKFEFTALPPATYRLTATRSGFLDRPAKRPVALGPGESAQTEIRLPPAGAIAGRVVDEAGEPMDRVRLWIYRQVYRDGRKLWDQLSQVASTDDRGEYRFSNLKPGRYVAQASVEREPVNNRYDAPPQAFYLSAFYPGVPSLREAAPVDVGAGVDAGGIEIRMRKVVRPPSVHIRGKVTGMPPDPQLVLYVGLIPAEPSGFSDSGALVKAPEFAFDVTAPPGRYFLSGNVYSGGSAAYGRVSMTISSDLSGVVLPMSPAPRLTGRIRVAEDGAIAKLEGIRLVLTRAAELTGDVQELRSDASGHFTSGVLQPDRWAIARIQRLPEDCYVREMRLGDQPIDPAGFEVHASAQLDIVLSCTAARITGTVLDAEGKPHAGAIVTLLPTAAKLPVDDSGAFHFDSLRPGKYTLFAWEEVDDDLWPDPDYRRKYEGRAVEVEVGPKETKAAQLRAIAP